MSIDLHEIHKAAVRIARMGGDLTLNYFRENIRIDRKDDHSPVTVADREAEKVMRSEIEGHYPGHGIVGEEFGTIHPDSEVQWILDPVDGTLSFIHGVPFYTTLVGVTVSGEPVSGVIYAPALDELCEAAKGEGARLNGERCSVRNCDSLEEATFLTTDLTSVAEHGYEKPFKELLSRTALHRTWGDAYGHMMVAVGRADLMFDPVLNIWDAAPLLTIMREAEGVFADTSGRETIETGNGFSCNRSLYPEIVSIFKNNR